MNKMALTYENVCCSAIYTIFEGTCEIPHLIIARAVSGVLIR